MNQLLGKVSNKILITGSSSFVGTALIKELSKNHHILCIDKKIVKKLYCSIWTLLAWIH